MTHHTDAEQERAEFDLYWLDRQRKRGFGQQLTDKEMLAYPERRADEFHAWQAARRAPAVPVETLETEYASCLAQCRDAFPVPGVNTELEGLWVAAMGCPLSVPEYIKAIAAAPQPPEVDHIPDAGKMVAAPVQLPEPIETVRYWRDAYANPNGDDHFIGHGMVVKIFDDYLALLAQHGIK